jgi:hypothetical protein
MSEPVDVIKTLLPFAHAIVELGDKLDALAGLDSQLSEATKALNAAKQQHADTKAAAEAASKAAADARAGADLYTSQRNIEIADNHRKSMAAIEEASNKAKLDAKAVLDNAAEIAAAKKLESERVAAETIAKAQADAQALADEHADLTAKTVAARSEYATAKGLLDEINARLDQHRRL